MRPVRTADCNTMFVGKGDTGNLFANLDEEDRVIKSVWEFSPEERRLIAEGCNLALYINGLGMQPTSMVITDQKELEEDQAARKLLADI
jgi:hypothetical protein